MYITKLMNAATKTGYSCAMTKFLVGNVVSQLCIVQTMKKSYNKFSLWKQYAEKS